MKSQAKTTFPLPPLLTGLLFAFASMGIAILILSCILLFTGFGEATLSVAIYAVHGAALLIGGFISGKKVETKGWYHGGATGTVYAVSIVLTGFLGFDSPLLHMESAIFLLLSLVVGALGGMIGVNVKNN